MDKKGRKRSVSGETLVETLASVLIISLSSVLLIAAALASFQVNHLADGRDEEVRLQQEYATKAMGHYYQDKDNPDLTGQTGTVTLQQESGGTAKKIQVTYSGGKDLISYGK